MDYRKESLRLHGEWKGKVEVVARAKVDNKDALSLAYTPGVAEPCRKIKANPDDVYTYTMKGRTGGVGGGQGVAVFAGGKALHGDLAGIFAVER